MYPRRKLFITPLQVLFRNCEDIYIVENDTFLFSEDEFAEGVLDAIEHGRSISAVEDNVEPVAITQVTGFDELIFAQLYVSACGASLDLNGDFVTIRALGEQVKAWPVLKSDTRRPLFPPL